MRILGLVVLIGVAGCGLAKFSHPTKGQDQFTRDKYECEVEAQKINAANNVTGSPWALKVETEKCLENRYGWTKTK